MQGSVPAMNSGGLMLAPKAGRDSKAHEPDLPVAELTRTLVSFVRACIYRRTCWVVLFAAIGAPLANGSRLEQVPKRPEVIRVPVAPGTDIRFRKLSDPQNLSQVRVDSIVQDSQGFLWFGTWNGLNRYDGYNNKVFKHQAGNDKSLSGTQVSSLFQDHAGNLWVGTDEALDRFDPVTETFQHYRLARPGDNAELSIVTHIFEDSHGFLWFSTQNGLFRIDAATGEMTNYRHVAAEPLSLGDNDIKSTGEDRSGAFWVATSRTLDQFDPTTGRVKRHIDIGESGVGFWFHEDRAGTFWVIYGSSGQIATLDRNSGTLIPYEYQVAAAFPGANQAYAMLEDHEGTMWFGTAGGLMRFDRPNRRFVIYRHDPSDGDSIGENRVIALFEDRENNIWIGLHQAEPNFFRKEPLPFENLTRKSICKNGEISNLVSAIYEDSRHYLWIAANRRLYRVNRGTGECSALKEADNSEVLSIVGQGADTLWLGNAGPGLLKYSLSTGRSTEYRHNSRDPVTLCSGVIDQLLVGRDGTLWAATWDGLCRFDATTQHFATFKPDVNTRGLNYYSIGQSPDGSIWLGGNLGLHRFDLATRKFKVWTHQSDSLNSISDNRVNAVFFDHSGRLWVGTQNGLDQLDPKTGNITKYDQRSGIAGNAVSCILEDARGNLWMSTNKGISSLNPETKRFANYTVADGLPGPDLTGWGSCYKSANGEMLFAGFSGATAFFLDGVERDQFALPHTVLTDFRLFGAEIDHGPKSPFRNSINHTDAITLSHEQNIFSIGFSALSYLNPTTNRYRYMLESLDRNWNEVGSDQRFASYTTLPAGTYIFRVQGATSRGSWDEPGARLRIDVLPAWYQTFWFYSGCVAALALVLWAFHQVRLRQLERQFDEAMEARVDERTRIARELHDTLLQSLHGLLFRFQAARNLFSRRPGEAMEALDSSIARTEQAIAESQDAITDLRPAPGDSCDLGGLLMATGKELETSGNTNATAATFALIVEGERQTLSPILRDEVYRIGRELLRNAFRHACARRVEAEVRYDHEQLLVRVRDDGKGMDPDVLSKGRRQGHWGLPGVKERAQRIGAQLDFWSEAGAGTEVQLSVPGTIAYMNSHGRARFRFFRRKRS